MREEELFWAYSSLRQDDQAKHTKTVYDAINEIGYRKCSVPRCVTLISLENGRPICRFCESKLSTGNVDNWWRDDTHDAR